MREGKAYFFCGIEICGRMKVRVNKEKSVYPEIKKVSQYFYKIYG